MQRGGVHSVRRFPKWGNFLTFAEEFLLQNEPCLFGKERTQGWKARALWQKEGRPDLDYLAREFGSAVVPVADCSHETFSTHPKSEMKLAEYIDYWRTLVDEPETERSAGPEGGARRSRKECTGEDSKKIRQSAEGLKKLLYLKDWHFKRDFPGYDAYSLLEFFQSDWLNELWDLRQDVCDDYRFVYMGPRGTWTPFHADVLRSYSWSANVCGCKEWLLFPPGEEDLLRDYTGNLPLDVTSSELSDHGRYPNAERSTGPIRVIQGPGEVIFIPSGWYHQVRNMEDTISINHNWTNAFGLQYMWRHLKLELQLVQQEIADCREMEAWDNQCQVILKASAGMDYHELFQLLCLLALPRIKELAKMVSKASSNSSATEAAGGLCVESLGLHELQDCLTRALSRPGYGFFGLRRKKPKEQEERTNVLWPLLCTEWLHIEPVAKDNIAAIVRECLQTSKDDSSSCTLGGLLGALPDKAKETVKQLVSSEEHRCANEQSLLVTFRAYELFCIQTVMTELLHSKEFIAVSPVF